LRDTGLRVQARAVAGAVSGAGQDEVQRVVFARAGVEVDDSRVRLSMTIDAEHVEVALEIPGAELRAVRARLADPERALQLTAALEALPEQFTIGAGGDDVRAPACRASSDHVRALVDRAETGKEPRFIWLGWSVPREVAVEHAAWLDEQLEDAIVALGSVFGMLTEGASRETAGGRGDRQDPARRRREDDRKVPIKRRARTRDREQELEGDDPEPDAEPEAARERDPGPRPYRGPGPKVPLRHAPRRRPPGATGGGHGATGPIEKGARVRVLEGPFAGKVGVVQELDGKGGARVMLGLLAVRLAVKDLVGLIEGRARPLLSSSHRKPLPVRS
jgi:hypothetical protein